MCVPDGAKDNAEVYHEIVEAKVVPGDSFGPAIEYVDGFLCTYGHPDEQEKLEF